MRLKGAPVGLFVQRGAVGNGRDQDANHKTQIQQEKGFHSVFIPQKLTIPQIKALDKFNGKCSSNHQKTLAIWPKFESQNANPARKRLPLSFHPPNTHHTSNQSS